MVEGHIDMSSIKKDYYGRYLKERVRKMKVKIFNEDYSFKLEDAINDFLEVITKDHDVIDIKFNYDRGNYATALIMYQPKLILTLEDYENGKCDEKVGKMVEDWIRQERNTKIFKSDGVSL